MEGEESDTDHTVGSSCQETQLSISHPSQKDSIKRLPKRGLSTGTLDEKHAVPNKKQPHSIQVPSTSTQNGEIMTDDRPLHDTEAQYREIQHSISHQSQNALDEMHTAPNMRQSHSIQVSSISTQNVEAQYHGRDQQCIVSTITNAIHVTQVTHVTNISPHYKLPPNILSVRGVRDTLATYYEEHLGIQRVSGEKLDLEKCYVNLAIVEAVHQQQIDRERLNEQSKTFTRMQSYENVRGIKLDSTIQIEDIFNKRELRDGRHDYPKKILILGRAGIGKTTF
ncbi:hypothetical protein BGZ76_001793, partial [Entomortierella beljakovae]